jgi:hypothetical protein
MLQNIVNGNRRVRFAARVASRKRSRKKPILLYMSSPGEDSPATLRQSPSIRNPRDWRGNSSRLAAFRESRSSQALYYILLFLLFFWLLYLRRSAQLLHPQVWDEDGTQVIPGLLVHGWKSLFYPVNGYLIFVPKVISAVSLSISGLYYPMVSTILAWIFVAGVCVAISVCPIALRGGPLLGVFTLLIPSDPEVFGIPLYTFWWASLLLFLVALWNPRSTGIKWRFTFIILGGLSSPIIFLVTPFLVLRAILFRQKHGEMAMLVAALLCCSAQAVAMLHSVAPLTAGLLNAHNLKQVLPKLIGGYLVGNFVRTTDHLVWIATSVFLAFVLLLIPFFRRRPWYLYLIALWCGTVYFIASRVDLSILHLRVSGPRYFFLPFVLLAWFLVSVLSEGEHFGIRAFAAVLLFASILNMLPVRSRPQRDFHWSEQLADCGRADPFPMEISFDGLRPWFVQVNRSECRALQQAGWIHLNSPVR